MVSFRGQKKLEPRPLVSFRGLISSWFNSKFPTSTPNPFICGVPPPGGLRYLVPQRDSLRIKPSFIASRR